MEKIKPKKWFRAHPPVVEQAPLLRHGWNEVHMLNGTVDDAAVVDEQFPSPISSEVVVSPAIQYLVCNDEGGSGLIMSDGYMMP